MSFCHMKKFDGWCLKLIVCKHSVCEEEENPPANMGEIEHLEEALKEAHSLGVKQGREEALKQVYVPEIYPLGTTGKFTDRMGNLYEKK